MLNDEKTSLPFFKRTVRLLRKYKAREKKMFDLEIQSQVLQMYFHRVKGVEFVYDSHEQIFLSTLYMERIKTRKSQQRLKKERVTPTRENGILRCRRRTRVTHACTFIGAHGARSDGAPVVPTRSWHVRLTWRLGRVDCSFQRFVSHFCTNLNDNIGLAAMRRTQRDNGK